MRDTIYGTHGKVHLSVIFRFWGY